jgi:hypothetical protein
MRPQERVRRMRKPVPAGTAARERARRQRQEEIRQAARARVVGHGEPGGVYCCAGDDAAARAFSA